MLSDGEVDMKTGRNEGTLSFINHLFYPQAYRNSH